MSVSLKLQTGWFWSWRICIVGQAHVIGAVGDALIPHRFLSLLIVGVGFLGVAQCNDCISIPPPPLFNVSKRTDCCPCDTAAEWIFLWTHHLTCALIRQVTALLSCDENGTVFPHIHKQLIRDDGTPAEKHQIFCKCWDLHGSSREKKKNNAWSQKKKSYFLFYRGWIHPQGGGTCSSTGCLLSNH